MDISEFVAIQTILVKIKEQNKNGIALGKRPEGGGGRVKADKRAEAERKLNAPYTHMKLSKQK